MPDSLKTTILVVDDEEQLRQLFCFDLTRRGFNVVEAGNGRDAFEILQREKIDLVLSDVRMPGGDGIELLNNIRNQHTELPVVMLITAFSDILLEDALNAGADAVFSKPFDRNELFSKIKNALLTREERWSERPDWPGHDVKIELKFPEMGIAVSGKLIHLGRGGMFVALDNHFPDAKSKVQFSISFDDGKPRTIEGDGIVQWVRRTSVEGLPGGCGIEFAYLTEDSRADVIDFIAHLNARAYIPKQ